MDERAKAARRKELESQVERLIDFLSVLCVYLLLMFKFTLVLTLRYVKLVNHLYQIF